MKQAIAKLRQHPIVKKADSFLRRRDGKLTHDLVLHPGKFGLGKVPAPRTGRRHRHGVRLLRNGLQSDYSSQRPPGNKPESSY